ncbi:hypothetical protein FB451DRAFT_1176762 [Mycena latifolia]|nr:hypothetical protein FB451DRAFT_1176762 [Mycena latifolia]
MSASAGRGWDEVVDVPRAAGRDKAAAHDRAHQITENRKWATPRALWRWCDGRREHLRSGENEERANIRVIYVRRLVAPEVVQARSSAQETSRDRREGVEHNYRRSSRSRGCARKREEKEEDLGPCPSSLPHAPPPGEMRHKRGWQREREWGHFTARGEQTRRRDVLLAHRAAHIRAEVAPQPAPRHAVHYVDAQSPTQDAPGYRRAQHARALDDALCRRPRTTAKSTGEKKDRRGTPFSSRRRRDKLTTPRAPRATTRAGAPARQYAPACRSPRATSRAPQTTASTAKGARGRSAAASDFADNTCKRGGAGREGKGRREARRSGWAGIRYMQTRAQCRDGYTAQKRERGGLDAKLRGDETHLPGPAPEIPIDWGCHVTDARRGTPSASAGREGTDGALAEWTAGENETTTKKTHLNSSICNSCSRGSFVRARRRAGAGEEETEARALDQAHSDWER